MFRHDLESQIYSGGQRGVAIILSVEFSKYYKLIEYKPLLTLDRASNEEYDRFIELKLSFNVKTRFKEDFSKKKKKIIDNKPFSTFQFNIL